MDSLSRVCPSPAVTKRGLAEGSTGTLFDMLIALLNVELAPVAATLRFLKQDGAVVTHSVAVGGRSRAMVNFETIAGLELASFSTVVESILPLVVDRTMRWDATDYGAHAETSVAAPATTWHPAEGSTSGDFALFYLLQNPNAAALTATITYRAVHPGRQPEPDTRRHHDRLSA